MMKKIVIFIVLSMFSCDTYEEARRYEERVIVRAHKLDFDIDGVVCDMNGTECDCKAVYNDLLICITCYDNGSCGELEQNVNEFHR